MNDLIWTAEKPIRPGWYWIGPVETSVMTVCHVQRIDGALWAVAGTWKRLASKVEALWAGPIPEPEYPYV